MTPESRKLDGVTARRLSPQRQLRDCRVRTETLGPNTRQRANALDRSARRLQRRIDARREFAPCPAADCAQSVLDVIEVFVERVAANSRRLDNAGDTQLASISSNLDNRGDNSLSLCSLTLMAAQRAVVAPSFGRARELCQHLH